MEKCSGSLSQKKTDFYFRKSVTLTNPLGGGNVPVNEFVMRALRTEPTESCAVEEEDAYRGLPGCSSVNVNREMSQSPDSRSLLSASSQLNLMEVESVRELLPVRFNWEHKTRRMPFISTWCLVEENQRINRSCVCLYLLYILIILNSPRN